MAGTYIGVSSKARKVKSIYVGVSGKARKVKKVYVGVSGKARLVYSAGPPSLALSSLPVGTLIRMAESGTEVAYRIIHQGLPSSLYDSSCNGTWVMREYIYARNKFDSTNNDYANSDVHALINGTFYGLFNSATQAVIKQVKIPYHNGTGSSGSVSSGSSGLSTKVFLLGGYELNWTTATSSRFPVDGACLSYFSGTAATDAKRIAYSQGEAYAWWLRSTYLSGTSIVNRVNASGKNANAGCTTIGGVRPAMVLNSTAVVHGVSNADGSYSLLV